MTLLCFCCCCCWFVSTKQRPGHAFQRERLFTSLRVLLTIAFFFHLPLCLTSLSSLFRVMVWSSSLDVHSGVHASILFFPSSAQIVDKPQMIIPGKSSQSFHCFMLNTTLIKTRPLDMGNGDGKGIPRKEKRRESEIKHERNVKTGVGRMKFKSF